MRMPIVAAAALVAAVPLPALAQAAAPDADVEESAARISERLADRATQERLSDSLATMSEVLLGLPLAPFVRGVAEMAGENPEAVDPDLTLRRMSPEAGAVPREIADKLPRMMGAMAGMADGFAAMMPALREMAARMDEAIEAADLPEG